MVITIVLKILAYFLPGMVIVRVAPGCNTITGKTAVVGEELILPLSGLEERFPLTRTSQPHLLGLVEAKHFHCICMNGKDSNTKYLYTPCK